MYYDKQKVIDWANSQIGYHEKASNSQLDDFTANSGNQNWNKYAAHLDGLGDFYNGKKNIGPDGAWCDIFVDDGFVTCYGREGAQFLLCQPDKSCGAGCAFSAQYFNAKGQFYKSGPQPGDQVFFGSAWNNVWHTGLVVAVSGSTVTTIEGNSSDQVAKRIYPLNYSSIWGYGRPAWGVKEDPSAAPDGDTQDDNGETVETPVVTVPATPSGGTCKPTLPELKVGSKEGYVKCLQRQLIAMGYDCGGKKDLLGREKPDGEFGEKTEEAVKDVQRKNGLKADGIVGEKTWPFVLNY